jgi:hypothetical protein
VSAKFDKFDKDFDPIYDAPFKNKTIEVVPESGDQVTKQEEKAPVPQKPAPSGIDSAKMKEFE